MLEMAPRALPVPNTISIILWYTAKEDSHLKESAAFASGCLLPHEILVFCFSRKGRKRKKKRKGRGKKEKKRQKSGSFI